jgi:hypothetical protein
MPQPGVFDNQIKPRAALGNAGGAFNQFDYTAGNSVTINRGDIVLISGSGASTVVSQAIALPGSNNSASLSGGSLGTLGVALSQIKTNSSGIDTSTGFNKTVVTVAIWDANLEVLMRGWNATAANTTISNWTPITSNYQLGRWRGANANTWWYFISTTTTNGELTYVEPYGVNLQASTDQYALMYVKAVSTIRQAGA